MDADGAAAAAPAFVPPPAPAPLPGPPSSSAVQDVPGPDTAVLEAAKVVEDMRTQVSALKRDVTSVEVQTVELVRGLEAAVVDCGVREGELGDAVTRLTRVGYGPASAYALGAMAAALVAMQAEILALEAAGFGSDEDEEEEEEEEEDGCEGEGKQQRLVAMRA
jgi:hypothetical protein